MLELGLKQKAVSSFEKTALDSCEKLLPLGPPALPSNIPQSELGFLFCKVARRARNYYFKEVLSMDYDLVTKLFIENIVTHNHSNQICSLFAFLVFVVGSIQKEMAYLMSGRKKVKAIKSAFKEDLGSKTAHDPFQNSRHDS